MRGEWRGQRGVARPLPTHAPHRLLTQTNYIARITYGGYLSTDLESLLALQADDVVIHGLEERLAALEPRILLLDQRKQRTLNASNDSRSVDK